MNSLPSTSRSRAPDARWMNRGDPPTALNALTGLSTPPGRTRTARENRRDDFVVRIRGRLRAGPARPLGERPSSLSGVVGDDDIGAGAADTRQRLEHRTALVDPAVPRRRLQHGVLAAHVI